MRVYRIILAVILVLAISCGIWYCISAYNEQRSNKDGLLVFEEYALQMDAEEAGME